MFVTLHFQITSISVFQNKFKNIKYIIGKCRAESELQFTLSRTMEEPRHIVQEYVPPERKQTRKYSEKRALEMLSFQF